ncbi:MAG: phosphocholine cytidylyltransferase family protein [Gammaproteobacteria bacterium]|nr:phosphocholine cytidylyltransferase family protein [Gammaproteobacteria bacterium]
MKGIILAAGRGSRLASLTENQPKCFTQLKGKPLIEWQLQALRSADVHDIAVVTGYQSHCFHFDLTYFFNEQWSESNMVTSLLSASAWLEHETCIVSYSDIVYSTEVVRSLQATTGDIVISYDPNWLELWQLRFEQPLDDAETFRIKDGQLLEIGSRPESLEQVEGQYMGLLKITAPGWSQISGYLKSLPVHEQKQLDMTGLLQRMLTQGVVINTIPINDRWFEVDNVSDLERYESLNTVEFL